MANIMGEVRARLKALSGDRGSVSNDANSQSGSAGQDGGAHGSTTNVNKVNDETQPLSTNDDEI